MTVATYFTQQFADCELNVRTYRMFMGPPLGTYKIVDGRRNRLTCLISTTDHTTLTDEIIYFGGEPGVGIPIKANNYLTPLQVYLSHEFKRKDYLGLMDGEIWYEQQQLFGGNVAIVEVWCDE